MVQVRGKSRGTSKSFEFILWAPNVPKKFHLVVVERLPFIVTHSKLSSHYRNKINTNVLHNLKQDKKYAMLDFFFFFLTIIRFIFLRPLTVMKPSFVNLTREKRVTTVSFTLRHI